MAWDQQGYYQDPYQQYGQDQYYDPYGYGGYQEPQEDTESEKLRKDQEEKERIEALESNRLYLKKIRKQCVKEDFAELDRVQLFLFEVLVESMEVNSESVLGVAPDRDHVSYISARVQFLNSPWMEICERDMLLEGSTQDAESDYMQAVGGAGYNSPVASYKDPYRPKDEQGGPRASGEEGGEEGEEGEEEMKFTTKWKNASGKSCLFSETPLTVIRDLERYPVVLQVMRCSMAADDSETCEPLGYAQLRLPDHFGLSVIQSSKDGVILPVSCVHQESLYVTNVFGVKKGKVDLFLRLSSFGPAIITSFQSSGSDRKYIFKPSPLDMNTKPQGKNDPPRSELLKPIIAEEERTVGITVQKDYDFFQAPVLWKKTDNSYNCGCMDGSDSNEEMVSRLSSVGSLRVPSSDLSLCKYVLPPSVFRKLTFEHATCDWHNLVSFGIKNSPGGNCGCLDSAQKAEGLGTTNDNMSGGTTPSMINIKGNQERGSVKPASARKVSRVNKMSLKPITSPAVKGFGLPKECTDCGCDCPLIKDALENKKLFLI